MNRIPLEPLLIILSIAALPSAARQVPWKPTYRSYACPATVTLRVPGTDPKSDIAVGVEADSSLNGHVEIAVASVISPGSIRAAIQDVPDDVRPAARCSFIVDPLPKDDRRTLHVRVGDGIAVVLLIGQDRFILPPGTVSHGGRIIEDDGRLFVLSVIAAAYQPGTYQPKETQQKGDRIWIT